MRVPGFRFRAERALRDRAALLQSVRDAAGERKRIVVGRICCDPDEGPAAGQFGQFHEDCRLAVASGRDDQHNRGTSRRAKAVGEPGSRDGPLPDPRLDQLGVSERNCREAAFGVPHEACHCRRAHGCRRIDQAELLRLLDRLAAAGHSELAIRRDRLRLHGVPREAEKGADFAERQMGREQREQSELGSRQADRASVQPRGHGCELRLEVHALSVEGSQLGARHEQLVDRKQQQARGRRVAQHHVRLGELETGLDREPRKRLGEPRQEVLPGGERPSVLRSNRRGGARSVRRPPGSAHMTEAARACRRASALRRGMLPRRRGHPGRLRAASVRSGPEPASRWPPSAWPPRPPVQARCRRAVSSPSREYATPSMSRPYARHRSVGGSFSSADCAPISIVRGRCAATAARTSVARAWIVVRSDVFDVTRARPRCGCTETPCRLPLSAVVRVQPGRERRRFRVVLEDVDRVRRRGATSRPGRPALRHARGGPQE